LHQQTTELSGVEFETSKNILFLIGDVDFDYFQQDFQSLHAFSFEEFSFVHTPIFFQ